MAIAGACVRVPVVAETGRKLQTTGMCSLWWEYTQGQQGVPNGGPTPCVPFYNGASFSKAIHAVLEAFPVESLTPCPLQVVSEQPTVVLFKL